MRWYDEANNTTTIYDIMGSSYDLLWSVESCRRLVHAELHRPHRPRHRLEVAAGQRAAVDAGDL